MQFDHIGIAVETITEASALWNNTLGFSTTSEEEVPGMGVRIRKIAAQGTTLELLEPTGNDGAIAKFLARRGPGIHHLSFHVDDIQKTTAAFRQKGYQPIYEKPRIGTGGCQVNFFHPKTTHGVLIEIAQPPANS